MPAAICLLTGGLVDHERQRTFGRHRKQSRQRRVRPHTTSSSLANSISDPILRRAVKVFCLPARQHFDCHVLWGLTQPVYDQNSPCMSNKQEPLAFWGGVVVGALGLNLKEDPLRSWLADTTAAAYVSIPCADHFYQAAGGSCCAIHVCRVCGNVEPLDLPNGPNVHCAACMQAGQWCKRRCVGIYSIRELPRRGTCAPNNAKYSRRRQHRGREQQRGRWKGV